MKGQNDCIYDFGPFRLDTIKRQLTHCGEILPLTSKAFDTLLVLIRHHGRPVAKNELIDALWFDTAVEENNLTQQISTLRKALGDDARHPQFIVTIPGRGYCFIAPVKENYYNAPETVSQSVVAENSKKENPVIPKERNKSDGFWNFSKYFQSYRLLFVVLLLALTAFSFAYFFNYVNSETSICVLPFKPLDNNEKSYFYSAGIPSYVTAKIGNLPNMIVRPTELSAKYYGQEQNVIEIGRSNNADAVLTGSTLCEGDVVQVTVHLWDVKNKRQIWAKIFTRKASDALSVQDSISEEIIYALRTELAN